MAQHQLEIQFACRNLARATGCDTLYNMRLLIERERRADKSRVFFCLICKRKFSDRVQEKALPAHRRANVESSVVGTIHSPQRAAKLAYSFTAENNEIAFRTEFVLQCLRSAWEASETRLLPMLACCTQWRGPEGAKGLAPLLGGLCPAYS